MSAPDRSRLSYKLSFALRNPGRVLPYARRRSRDALIGMKASDHISYYRRPARPGGSRPGPAGLPAGVHYRVKVATHSTWWVMGNASNARSAPSCQPASANTAMSRASVAGSQDT